MSWTPEATAAVVDKVLALARQADPAAEVSVEVLAGRSANTRFARSEITSTGDVEEAEITLSVAFGQREAKASSNQTDEASLRSLVDRTMRLARLAPEDPERMPVLGPQTYAAAPSSSWEEATATLSTSVRADAIAAALSAADAAKVELAGFYTHSSRHLVRGTSAGQRGSFSSTWAHFSCTARTPDGTGSGWAQGEGNRASDFDPAKLAAVAIDKASRSVKPQKLEPGRYTVIFEPSAVASLLQFLVRSMDARSAEEGRSFYARPGSKPGRTRLGERLFSKSVTIVADPFDPALPDAPFDSEGNPRERTVLVDRGTLRFLRRSRFWAKKTGTKPTANPGPWQLLPGDASTAELIAKTERGLLVTRLWYLRMLDPNTLTVTGLTRDGLFLVEGGAVVGPVNNFRFNDSPANLLANLDALGSEAVRVQGARVPALRSRDFLMSSISDAV